MKFINYLQNYIKQEYKPEDLADRYYQIKWECVCRLAGYSTVFPDEKMSPDEMKVIIDKAFEKMLDKIW